MGFVKNNTQLYYPATEQKILMQFFKEVSKLRTQLQMK